MSVQIPRIATIAHVDVDLLHVMNVLNVTQRSLAYHMKILANGIKLKQLASCQ